MQLMGWRPRAVPVPSVLNSWAHRVSPAPQATTLRKKLTSARSVHLTPTCPYIRSMARRLVFYVGLGVEALR